MLVLGASVLSLHPHLRQEIQMHWWWRAQVEQCFSVSNFLYYHDVGSSVVGSSTMGFTVVRVVPSSRATVLTSLHGMIEVYPYIRMGLPECLLMDCNLPLHKTRMCLICCVLCVYWLQIPVPNVFAGWYIDQKYFGCISVHISVFYYVVLFGCYASGCLSSTVYKLKVQLEVAMQNVG